MRPKSRQARQKFPRLIFDSSIAKKQPQLNQLVVPRFARCLSRFCRFFLFFGKQPCHFGPRFFRFVYEPERILRLVSLFLFLMHGGLPIPAGRPR